MEHLDAHASPASSPRDGGRRCSTKAKAKKKTAKRSKSTKKSAKKTKKATKRKKKKLGRLTDLNWRRADGNAGKKERPKKPQFAFKTKPSLVGGPKTGEIPKGKWVFTAARESIT